MAAQTAADRKQHRADILRRLRGNIAFWIALLLGMLLVANLLSFIIYQRAFPDQDIWSQLWNYLGSDAFAIITASLVFPILAILVESRFKIADRFRSQRRERRLEAVEDTVEMWNDVYDLASEVRYFNPKVQSEKDIDDILRRLATLPSRNTAVANMWAIRFPSLKLEHRKLLAFFINVLEGSAYTVAHYLKYQNATSKEIQKLQSCLGVIQTGTRLVSQHGILSTLKYYVELEEDGMLGRLPGIEAGIEANLGLLEYNASCLRLVMVKHFEILPYISNTKAEAFREAAAEFQSWLGAKGGRSFTQYERSEELLNLFADIPNGYTSVTRELQLSKRVLEDVADFLACVIIANDLAKTAGWPKTADDIPG